MAKPAGTIFVELTLDDKVYKERLSGQLTSTQATVKGIETSWRVLGQKNDATYDAMRRSYENALTLIKNSTTATAADIVRAEEAKNAKIKALNDRQFGAQITAIDTLKKNWLAASAAVAAAAVAINKAMVYVEEGAKGMQVESSFRIMADSAEVNADRLIASMKKATRETIDDSDMMQKAIKLMTLGYNPEQIERFSKVVITASQIAGTTAAEAYGNLADAIADRMPKALVKMGAATKEQMAIVSAAIEAGADSTVLYELAMANLELKQKMLQGTQDQAIIAMQRLNTQTKEMTEAIGKGLIWVLDKAYHSVEFYAAAIMGLVSAYAQYRALVYSVMGDEKQAADNRWVADRAMETRTDLLKKWGDAVWDTAEADKRAAKDEIAGAQAKVDAQMKVLKSVADSKEGARKAEAEAKKSAEVNKNFWEDYKKEVEGAIEFEKFKLDEQYRAFDQYVQDKVALLAWYQSERRKIDIKEFADTVGTQFPADAYSIESDRAKAYKANQKALEEYGKSYEEQLAAMQEADKKLSEENWWKTYVEDVDNATRANEIFKDSMNIMSQSASDAFAEFVTGTKSAKEAFTQMVQSMISAMARIQSQKAFESLFGMIISGAGSLFGGMFGGETATGMGTNTTFSGGGTMGGYISMVKHSGGLMTETGPTRYVPAMAFANAPRYHDGFQPGEIPAILKKDEGVFTPGQMKALGNRSLTINVPVTAAARDNRMASDLRAEIENTVERVVRRYS